MEVPEKIYLQDSMSTDTIGDLWPEWFDAKISDNSIEYIRTDAFIEKACEWLESVNLDFYQIREGVFSRQLVEDFRNYMKGE